jgi:putative transposase
LLQQSHSEGWIYLVVFLDLCSRLVIGWAVSESLDEAGFVEQVFLQGQSRRGGAVSPLVHSDGGSQYASLAFRERLAV